MKLAPLLSLLLFMHAVAFGRDTAYKALRTVGKERGQSVLNRVIEVKGGGGSPQPAVWKIVLDDQAARGGVREFEVENGRIASERTPVKAYSGSSEGAVMNFQKLNLDSQGAFTVAEKEASKAQVGFDSVDYVLRTDDETRSPVWILRLLDSDKSGVGTIRVSAVDGRVLLREGFGSHRSTAPAENPSARNSRDADSYEADQNPNGVGHKIKRGFLKAGASVEEFFSGKRTLDSQYNNE